MCKIHAMWIFTKFGFFSVVQYSPSPGTLVVRARTRSDLEALLDRHGQDLGYPQIIETPTADYCCRVLVPAPAWASVMSRFVDDIDYSNFKDTVRDAQGKERADVYGRVWHTMLSIQHSTMNWDGIFGLNDHPKAV